MGLPCIGALTRRAIVPLLALAAMTAAQADAQPTADPRPVRVILRARLPASGAAPRLVLEGQAFQASPALACFYQRRDFASAWSDGEALRPQVEELFAALQAAPDDGLRTEDYRLAALQRQAAAVRSRPDAGSLADLDLLLSDAFLTFAGHLSNGKVNPAAIYRDCALGRDTVDPAAVLESALQANRVRAALAELAPSDRGYELLRAALGRYRRLALLDVAEPIPPGPTLRQGIAGSGSPRCGRAWPRPPPPTRTAGAEPLPPAAEPDRFDVPLAAALRRFQARHGLEEDGVAGRAVLAELNQRAADHVRQIEINLDRWRWLPRDLGERTSW